MTRAIRRKAAARAVRPAQASRPVERYQLPPAGRPPINRSANLALHPQLPVSQPGDQQELQADQLADGALRAADGGTRPDPDAHRSGGGATIARLPADPGRSLDDPVRRRFERGFGTDLSGVRIHTGGQAAGASRALAASAFTVGSDIAFDTGRYAPDSQSGERLLAHELAHVVQAGAGIARQPAEDSAVQTAATLIVGKVRDGDVAGVVTELEHNLGPGLSTLRSTVSSQIGQPLERWLLNRAHRAETIQTVTRVATLLAVAVAPVTALGTLTPRSSGPRPSDSQTAERGIRLLWPTLSLVARLQL
ncbi:MAG TPA: DUF4157 domain-containing protein, partial [Jatrophihabitans sp.]|nr:DUF4157 domain-containing protein [Jatrophihabitans sp.]